MQGVGARRSLGERLGFQKRLKFRARLFFVGYGSGKQNDRGPFFLEIAKIAGIAKMSAGNSHYPLPRDRLVSNKTDSLGESDRSSKAIVWRGPADVAARQAYITDQARKRTPAPNRYLPKALPSIISLPSSIFPPCVQTKRGCGFLKNCVILLLAVFWLFLSVP